MTPKKRGPARAATPAEPLTQTRELARTPEGDVPEGAPAHRSIGATFLDAFTGTFRARDALSVALYLSSFGCLVAAFVELTEPAHPLHAGLLVLAAIAAWVLAAAVGR